MSQKKPQLMMPSKRLSLIQDRTHSRSPSRSTARTQKFVNDEMDPLLSDLSPTKTLEALNTYLAIGNARKEPSGALQASISRASPSERAFGIKAALASKKLHDWCVELAAWEWPDIAPPSDTSKGFQPPLRETVERQKPVQSSDVNNAVFRDGTQENQHLSTQSRDTGSSIEEYWGSLPKSLVLNYEQRLDEIDVEMEYLEVEELKIQVLDAHIPSRSRPNSSNNLSNHTSLFLSYNHLDDFTAFTTATVLQALPDLSKLSHLMSQWTVRLAVLRKTPNFLSDLNASHIALRSAWKAFGLGDLTDGEYGSHPQNSGIPSQNLTKFALETAKSMLGRHVDNIGKQLDSFLDSLEGREETVPEDWIDRVDALEAGYGEWVVQAERCVLENDLRMQSELREKKRRQEEEESLAQEYMERNAAVKKEPDLAHHLVPPEHGSLEKSKDLLQGGADDEGETVPSVQTDRNSMSESDDLRQQDQAIPLMAPEELNIPATTAPLFFKAPEATAATYDRQSPLEKHGSKIESNLPDPPTQPSVKHNEEAISAFSEPAQAITSPVTNKNETCNQNLSQGLGKPEVESKTSPPVKMSESEVNPLPIAAHLPSPNRPHTNGLETTLPTSYDGADDITNEKSSNADAPKQLPNGFTRSKDVLPTTKEDLPTAKGDILTVEALPATKNIPSLADETLPAAIDAVPATKDVLPAVKAESSTSPPNSSLNENTSMPNVENHIEERTDEPTWTTSESHISETQQQPKALPNGISNFSFSGYESVQLTSKSTVNDHTASPQSHEIWSETPKSEDVSAQTEGTLSLPKNPININPVTSEESFPEGNSYASPRSDQNELQRESTKESSNYLRLMVGKHPALESTRSSTSSGLSTAPIVSQQNSLAETNSPPEKPVHLGPLDPVEVTDQNQIKNDEAAELFESKVPAKSIQQESTSTPGRMDNQVQSNLESSPSAIPAPGFSHQQQDLRTDKSYPVNDDYRVIEDIPNAIDRPSFLRTEPSDRSYGTNFENPQTDNGRSLVTNGIISTPNTNVLGPSFPPPDSPPISTHISSSAVIHTKTESKEKEIVEAGKSPQQEMLNELAPVMTLTSEPEVQGDISGHGESFSDSALSPSVQDISGEIRLPYSIPNQDSFGSDDLPGSEHHEIDQFDPEMSPSVRQFHKHKELLENPKVILNPLPVLRMSKRRSRNMSNYDIPVIGPEEQQELQKTQDEIVQEESPLESPVYLSPSKQPENHLEQKISSILTTLPGRIRLTTEADAVASVRKRKATRNNQGTPPPRISRSSTASPSFALAPAPAKQTRPRPQHSNPDIKLYHLHRSSDEAPIKLFVRLVGESGERVMVRVGGGWADLGEYLKEYASHHGRRSNSDGRVEIQDIPRGSSSNSSNILSGRATPTGLSRPSSAMGRSVSSLSIRRSRLSDASPDEGTSPFTPFFPGSGNRRVVSEMTPSSATSSNRPSSRMSWTEEESSLGLAGPRSKKTEMSKEKQAWVDGMIGQVRKASAEKKAREEWGEISRVEGVRRVFKKA